MNPKRQVSGLTIFLASVATLAIGLLVVKCRRERDPGAVHDHDHDTTNTITNTSPKRAP